MQFNGIALGVRIRVQSSALKTVQNKLLKDNTVQKKIHYFSHPNSDLKRIVLNLYRHFHLYF